MKTSSVLLMLVIVCSSLCAPSFADDPLRLVMNGTWQTAVNHYYVGQVGNYMITGSKMVDQGVPGFQWDIYFRDYYNDEWRMNKVRDYGGVEYYIGNRYVPSNGKRYASSASVFHSDQGDVISFVSQNWQKEKSFAYNMIRQNDYRMYGCEYWIGIDRYDNFYMRNAWIELQKGTFGGKTRGKVVKTNSVNEETETKEKLTGFAALPKEIWGDPALEEGLEMRLGEEEFNLLKEQAYRAYNIPEQANVKDNEKLK